MDLGNARCMTALVLASPMSGITGEVICADCGYNIMGV
jgi:enoyl-[acyl-carrier-protein] reductase (NADH)